MELEKVKSKLRCPICCCLLCKPISTPCGHSFCRACLAAACLKKFNEKQFCPTCRTPLHACVAAFRPSIELTAIISECFPDEYAARIKEHDASYNATMTKIKTLLEKHGGVSWQRRYGNLLSVRRGSSDAADFSSFESENENENQGDGTYSVIEREEQQFGDRSLRWTIARDPDDMNQRILFSFGKFPQCVVMQQPLDIDVVILRMEEDEISDGGVPPIVTTSEHRFIARDLSPMITWRLSLVEAFSESGIENLSISGSLTMENGILKIRGEIKPSVFGRYNLSLVARELDRLTCEIDFETVATKPVVEAEADEELETARGFGLRVDMGVHVSSDEDDYYDNEEEDEMDGFIVDDDEEIELIYSEEEDTHENDCRILNRKREVEEENESDRKRLKKNTPLSKAELRNLQAEAAERRVKLNSKAQKSDDDDETPIRVRRKSRKRNKITISSDEEEI
eukprot:g6485.t1